MRRFLLLAAILPQMAFAQKIVQKEFISPEIEPMVGFIKGCNTSPVDYVLGLFDKYDVVVLGERDHMDTTQYDLIASIISDPRFIAKVGHVMTEIGSYNMAARLNRVVQGSYPHDSVFDVELVRTLFDFNYMPAWDKANYSQLCKDIYRINKTLPASRKISLTPTDISFSWEQTRGMTGKQFSPFYRLWPQKDLIMGNNTINELYNIFDGPDPRKKALVIYNTPHSCRHFKNADDWKFFACQIIADRFPGRVANVVINWLVGSNEEGYTSLSNGGKIDAAFAAAGNKEIGFDLAGTPVGDCMFDFFEPKPSVPTKFSSVYHGFIFYKPVMEWVDSAGVPDLDKIDCRDELARRFGVWNDEDSSSDEYKDSYYKNFTTVRSFPLTAFFDENIIKEQIGRYYRPAVPAVAGKAKK